MKLTLHLTTDCNMNCLYCYNSKNEYIQEMTFEIAQKTIEYAIKKTLNSKIEITFVGGEPLLKIDLIIKIVEYCNKQVAINFLFSILTNGLLLDGDFIKFSLQNNIAISLSIDGNEQAHNLYRKIGNSDSWEKIKSKFELLISKLPESMILLTLNPETVIYLTESITYLVKKGAKAISISLNYITNWKKEHLYQLNQELLKLSEFYKLGYKNNQNFYLNIFDSRIHSLIDGFDNKGRCDSNGNHLSIAPNGDFFPCIAFVKNDSEFVIGNIDRGISLSKLTRFHKDRVISNGVCDNCEIKDRCFKWCACSNYLATGKINEISPVLCEFEKMLIPVTDEIAMELYNSNNQNFMKNFYGIIDYR